MTTQEILVSHNIEMISSIVNNTINKSFLGGDHLEAYFNIGFNSFRAINEDVLPILYHFRDGNNPPMDNDLGGIPGNCAYIYEETLDVIFIGFENEIVQTVPLDHFISIAEAWRDFLLTPPLHGSKVH
jgi:hypothetical protein